MPSRPPVSVIVPFLGTDPELELLIDRLLTVTTRPGDEVIIADNRTADVQVAHERVIVHSAGGVHSPGFARNRGAARARGEWLVFIDADTEPDPELLDAYFDPMPDAKTAVLGGAIRDVLPPGVDSPVAQHIVESEQMAETVTLDRARYPYALSANCAIRRSAFVAAGGFAEAIRAGEDADLNFRLRAAGWDIERRAGAVVAHRARATVNSWLAQLAVHGAGAAWCNRRHPGSFPPSGTATLTRRLGRLTVNGLGAKRRGDAAAVAAAKLDIAGALAFELGRLLPNRVVRDMLAPASGGHPATHPRARPKTPQT